MHTIVTSRHFKAHSTLTSYAEEAVNRLGKYYDGIITSNVILSYERSRDSKKRAEITVHVYNAVLAGHSSTDDFFRSIDAATEKVRTQLQKYKAKLRRRDKISLRRVKESA